MERLYYYQHFGYLLLLEYTGMLYHDFPKYSINHLLAAQKRMHDSIKSSISIQPSVEETGIHMMKNASTINISSSLILRQIINEITQLKQSAQKEFVEQGHFTTLLSLKDDVCYESDEWDRFKGVFVSNLVIETSYIDGKFGSGAIRYTVRLPKTIYESISGNRKGFVNKVEHPVSAIKSIGGAVEVDTDNDTNCLSITIHLPEKSVTEIESAQDTEMCRKIIAGTFALLKEEDDLLHTDDGDSPFVRIDDDMGQEEAVAFEEMLAQRNEQADNEVNVLDVVSEHGISYTWTNMTIERRFFEKTYTISFDAGLMGHEKSRELLSMLLEKVDIFIGENPFFNHVGITPNLDVSEDLRSGTHIVSFSEGKDQKLYEGMVLHILEDDKAVDRGFSRDKPSSFTDPAKKFPYLVCSSCYRLGDCGTH